MEKEIPESHTPVKYSPEMEGYQVSQSNELVEASYHLSDNEQRLLMFAAMHIDPIRPKNVFEFTIHATDFAKAFGLQDVTAYRFLKELTDTIYEREIVLKKRDTKGKTRLRWVYKADYIDNEGTVVLGLSPDITHHLTKLHSRFTSTTFQQIKHLSFRSFRIFNLLKNKHDIAVNYKKKPSHTISLDEFKRLLDIEDQYPRFCDFKKWVLLPIVQEINDTTNMTIGWEPDKRGRTTVGIYFKEITMDEQMSLEM